ncbi:alpha/beta hydrolase family protein [Ornithinimicrobium cerasi]|uniref:Prolyl oligopeptidase family protein n=1 Tax=Ornithinimicrobium cerasi TaxID=2248773 RepID=A0A285VHZ3_9MICO|nr:alpha/beta fold hydrolase [Ornithinimicrobium cerasi]SOC53623.1 Prolyl oligopeptidase family protein [Ornithinimicrobium cerasi]
MGTILRYGAHPDQVVEVLAPAGVPRGAAVLLHGGYWRAQFTWGLMEPLAQDLVGRGWEVANVEYRRLGTEDPEPSAAARGGAWPTSLIDATSALAAVADHLRRSGVHLPVVSVGHSVGGQLALLTAAQVDAVVALAPVTDLARTREEGLGEDAVRGVIPEPPEERPEAYAEGSPVHQLPVGRPTLLVHGDADTRVPLTHSEDYLRRATELGDVVELRVVTGLDHLGLIRPDAPHWPGVVEWMDGREDRATRPGPVT